jgi:hypothetical protein
MSATIDPPRDAQRQAGAARMRRARERRAAGVIQVGVEVDAAGIDALVMLGLLAQEMSGNREAVADALGSLVRRVSLLPPEGRRVLVGPQPMIPPPSEPLAPAKPGLGNILAEAIARRHALIGGA